LSTKRIEEKKEKILQKRLASTLAQACKAIVTDAIDHDYLAECGTLASIYNAEYGSYNGVSPKACKDYLQGLPSVCTVPFWNDEILELLAAQGISRKSEAAKDKLIEDYWLACGYQFYQLVR